ncbi:unnamed protein product, partial [Polarella glacialis]
SMSASRRFAEEAEEKAERYVSMETMGQGTTAMGSVVGAPVYSADPALVQDLQGKVEQLQKQVMDLAQRQETLELSAKASPLQVGNLPTQQHAISESPELL